MSNVLVGVLPPGIALLWGAIVGLGAGVLIAIAALFGVWGERKVSARMQWRLGPQDEGQRHGNQKAQQDTMHEAGNLVTERADLRANVKTQGLENQQEQERADERALGIHAVKMDGRLVAKERNQPAVEPEPGGQQKTYKHGQRVAGNRRATGQHIGCIANTHHETQ